jgi:lipopolysaccharide assembly outer membrane protein LptD (OstA)
MGAESDTTAAQVTGSRLRQQVIDGVPILLLDDVTVVHGPTRITGKAGRYDRNAGFLTLEGDVLVIDRETAISGRLGTYQLDTGIATLKDRVAIQRGDLLIRGPRAIYERSTGVTRLGGGVRVKDSQRTVIADSVVYWVQEDRAMAFGHVKIDEAGEHEAKIQGEVAEYKRREGDLKMLEQASLRFEDQGKPVEITALDFAFSDQGKVVHAQGNVLVKQGTTQAAAEDAVFYQDHRRAILTGSPVARDQNGEIQGDTLEVGFQDGEMRRLESRGRARSVYGRDLPEGGHEELRLKADTLIVELAGGEARAIQAGGSAESLYLPAGEARRAGALRNSAKADRIRVELTGGQAERVILEGQAEGEYRYRAARQDTVTATLAAADSLRALPADSTRAPAGDSTLVLRPDSTLVLRPDSTLVLRPDSTTAAVPDSAVAEIDSLGAGFGALAALPPDSLLQIVRYKADRIDYLVERDEILLIEHADLTHGSLHLTAGRVRFSAKERTLLASEQPLLEDRNQELSGETMAYDFDTKEGQVLSGKTTFDQAVYSGNRLYRSGEGVIHVRGADYTTCAVEPPHYHFAGDRMKIYLDDKVVTQPIGLFIRRVPVLALPFYVFPIRRGRHSGLLFPQLEFGFSESRGRFVHNAGYYWVVNDYADLKLWGDFNELSPFFVGNAEVHYAQRYRLSGGFKSSFTVGQDVQRFDLLGEHRHDLGERRTLQVNADFLSDREFRRDDQGQATPNRLESNLRSNLTYTKSWSSQSLSARVDRNQNLQNLVGETQSGIGIITGTLPALSYSFGSRPIGRLPDSKGRGARMPYLSSTNYAFSGRYERNFDNRREPDIYLQTASAQGSIADRRKVAMFNVGPSFSITSNWDERSELPDTAGVLRPDVGQIFTGSMTTALDAQTEAYGSFRGALGPFKGFRHIVTPRASLSYSKSYNSREDIEGAPARSLLNLAVANRLETRVPAAEGRLRDLRDFLTANLSTSYDLSNTTPHRFAPLRGDARFRPGVGRDFEVSYQWTYDAYRRQTLNYSTSTRFTLVRAGRAPQTEAGQPAASPPGGYDDPLGGLPGEEEGFGEAGGQPPTRVEPPAEEVFPKAFSIGSTLSYAGGSLALRRSLQTTISTAFYATPKWKVEYNLRYDLIAHQVVGQSYSLGRNLHCWEAQFRRYYETGRWEYYFQVRIRDLPEIFYERGRDRSTYPTLY